jgi:hypothetical protein
LSEEDKLDYFNAALSGFASKLYDVFGIEADGVDEEEVEEDSDETTQVPLAMQPDGSLGIDPNASETRYSMYDTALENDIDLAEFAFIKAVANKFRNALKPVKGLMKKEAPSMYKAARNRFKKIKTKGIRQWRGAKTFAKANPIKTGAAIGATGVAGGIAYNALKPKQPKPWGSS